MQEIYKFGEIQVDVEIINNQPMFELYSTGMALGQVKSNTIKGITYKQCRKDRVDENVKNAEIKPLVHNGLMYINESQLYDLMLEMKTDKVKPFRKWITNEVLPQIRLTGGYIQENREEEFIDKYFPSFEESTKLAMVHDLKQKNKEYQEQISQLEPQAKAYQDLMTAKGYLQMIDICGMVDKGRNSLFEFLRANKVLSKQSAFNVPYERFKKNGMFKVITCKDDKGYFSTITMVSPKGLIYIYKLLKKNDMLDEFNSSLLLELQEMEVSA